MAASLLLRALLAILVPSAGALIKIELKNGKTIDVNVDKKDVAAILFLEEEEIVEKGEVLTLVAKISPRATTKPLKNGTWYVIEAKGAVSYWKNKKAGADAVWCYAIWRCGRKGVVWSSLRIDKRGLVDIAGHNLPYNPLHVYSVRYKGRGKPLELLINKTNSDSRGTFTVKITPE